MKVGTSGRIGDLSAAAMARPMVSPLLTAREMFPVAVAASTFTSPVSRPIIAGLPPGNGMCFTGAFASTLKKYSAAMCEPLPMPAEPMNTFPAFASVTSSASVLIDDFVLTESDSGAEIGSDTASNWAAVYPRSGTRDSLMASDVVVTRMV